MTTPHLTVIGATVRQTLLDAVDRERDPVFKAELETALSYFSAMYSDDELRSMIADGNALLMEARPPAGQNDWKQRRAAHLLRTEE